MIVAKFYFMDDMVCERLIDDLDNLTLFYATKSVMEETQMRPSRLQVGYETFWISYNMSNNPYFRERNCGN